MIRNLEGAGAKLAAADVLVVGAGTIGLVLVTELAARGLRVICFESGGREQRQETHPLNAVEQQGTPYIGASHGRFRCLGGSSTRWGGALIPFQEADLRGASWPLDWHELAPFVDRVEEIFGLPKGSYDDPTIMAGPDFLARLAKWPSFGRRNTYALLRAKVDGVDGPEIWINATATWFVTRRGRLAEVTAQASDGSQITVTADEVIIAAGAIESTRLLCLINRQNGGVITGRYLGEGFYDHLSAKVADIAPIDRTALNELAGFRFTAGGGMRNLRFELAPHTPLRGRLRPCFAHISFSDTPGGFAALRELLRAVQRRKAPPPSLLARLAADLPWLTRAVWWRLVRKRLLYPVDARLELHMVVEQTWVASNRINLSDTSTDPFGQPLGQITWRISPDDIAMMERAAEAFAQQWASGPLARLGSLRFRSMADVAKEMACGGGTYHPGGSTRMAATAESGPLDSNLRVFGIANLGVCSTSVLPSGGGANPTMMALLLGLRYVARLR